jgi:hypothetical protein
MDRSKSILKVMKALKDAKTWTSEAKRAAKERRESRNKDGSATDKGVEAEAAKAAKETTVTKETNTEATSAADPTTPVEGATEEGKTAPPPSSPANALEPVAVDATTIAAPPETETDPPKVADEETEKVEKDPNETIETPVEPEAEAKDSKDEPKAKEDKSAKTETKKTVKVEKEEEISLANSRPRRTSKRRVQLPLSGAPAPKVAKKGSEDVVDSTNDAVRGLHLLSQATQAVARDKKGKPLKVELV